MTSNELIFAIASQIDLPTYRLANSRVTFRCNAIPFAKIGISSTRFVWRHFPQKA